MCRIGLTAIVASFLIVAMARAETIRLGAILPLTGPAASIGALQMRGIQFAIDQANALGGVRGHEIEVVFEDNQAQPDQSIPLFNQLADVRHLPVIFTAYSGPTLAMAPLATRKKVLLINAGAQADKLATASPYLFNTLPSTRHEIAAVTRYVVNEGSRRAVILFENSAAGISGRDDFLDAFPNAGGTIEVQETTLFGQTDFRPALLKLAAAKPEVMLVSITAGLPLMARQYRELGLNFLVAGTTFFQDPEMIRDPAAEGFVHTQSRAEVSPEVAAAFRKEFDAEMAFHARQYYNATRIVLTTLDKVLTERQPVTGETMRDMVLKIRRFPGPTPLEFTTNTAMVPLDINVIRGGKDITIRRVSND